jgi:peptide deformylase
MHEIVQEGAPILRSVSEPVPDELFNTKKLEDIVDAMKRALDPELEGVALAAPQIGIPYRIFVVRVDRTLIEEVEKNRMQSIVSSPEYAVYVNPEIVKTSKKRASMDEGCLSVRGVYGTTKRHERVTIRARHPDGSRVERGGGGLMAQIFEHEIDHLNGILFIDHATNLIHIEHEPKS